MDITLLKYAVKLRFCLAITLLLAQNSFATAPRVITVQEPPANYLNRNGQVDGYVSDIVKAMYKKMGKELNIEVLPEARAIHISQKEPNLILFSFSRTSFREDRFHWVGEVLRKSWYIYSINGSFNRINSLEQLKKVPVIGVTRGDVREEFLIENSFNNLNSITNHEQNVQLLLLGRLPLIAYEQLGLYSTCKILNKDCTNITQIYKLNTASGYIMMSKQPGNDNQLLKELTNAYNSVLTSGEMSLISKRWKNKLREQDLSVDIATDKPILIF